jgi:uncharacterized protein (TIGR00730 family)
MAKFLRDLLDAEEPIFGLSIRDLENASGNQAADARLMSDIIRMAHDNMRDMHLDPNNTTGKELYHALLARVEQDNRKLAHTIGAKDPDDVAHMVPYMVAAAESVKFNRRVFVLKHSKAQELLRKMPPKNLMTKLGYSDVDAMFAGEDFDEMYTALRFSEGPEWLNEYDELFKHVSADDYEHRNIRIVVMDHEKYADLAEHFVQKKLHNVTHTKELGVIVVVPMKQERMKGLPLKTLPLLLHYMNELKLYSTFFEIKSKTVKKFGEVVMETLIADTGTGAQMAGKHVHWRVIQRYLGRHREEATPEAFEPHVHPEDLHWRRAEDLLYQIDPDLKFWKNRDYVGLMFDDFPVAFNLFDVSFAYSNGEPYENRYAYHFRESLWNELFARYMGMGNLEQQILQQLDNDMIKPEKLSVEHHQHHKEISVDVMTTAQMVQHARHLRSANEKSDLLIRKKLIGAAEGRLVGVVREFDNAFEILEKYPHTVTMFGSARLPSEHPSYQQAVTIAARLATEGFAVVTGGGGGIMEAANKGAYEAGGNSIGFNIRLPHEQHLNEYTTEHFTFEHFFARKVCLTLDAHAYIFYAGGYGTMDELFEIMTLVQTGDIPKAPIILVGSDFWSPLAQFFAKTLDAGYHTIDAVDLDLYTITDDVDEIATIVKKFIPHHHKKS